MLLQKSKTAGSFSGTIDYELKVVLFFPNTGLSFVNALFLQIANTSETDTHGVNQIYTEITPLSSDRKNWIYCSNWDKIMPSIRVSAMF